VGSSYDIDINISGREWEDRYFVSLKAWRVSGEHETPLEEGVNYHIDEVKRSTSSIKDDDLPF